MAGVRHKRHAPEFPEPAYDVLETVAVSPLKRLRLSDEQQQPLDAAVRLGEVGALCPAPLTLRDAVRPAASRRNGVYRAVSECGLLTRNHEP